MWGGAATLAIITKAKPVQCIHVVLRSTPTLRDFIRKRKMRLLNPPTAIGDTIAKAPGFIISFKDADATMATHRP